MKNTKINYTHCLGFIAILLCFLSCQNDEERALKEKLSSTSPLSTAKVPEVLSSAVINEYKEAELAINRRYINEVHSVIAKDFEEQLDEFEDKELGFFRSYKHMFKTLIESDDEMNDYWNLKKSKYFSTINTQNKLHECYKSYTNDIYMLRNQISRSKYCKAIPEEIKFNIQSQDISLSKMSQHSYTNLAIEFGTDIAIWLIVTGIISVITLFVGIVTYRAWIVTVLSIITSILLSMYNDNRMIDSIRKQYNDEIQIDNDNVLKHLDKSTNSFYDYVSK